LAYGETCTVGTIEAKGGASPNLSYGGGGGGGHIHFAGHTSTFTGLDVSGGISSLGSNGSDGTTETVDLDSDQSGMLGGKDSDVYAGWLTKLIQGALV
jgi:hypothetical protein